jgi:hypothetical protein
MLLVQIAIRDPGGHELGALGGVLGCKDAGDGLMVPYQTGPDAPPPPSWQDTAVEPVGDLSVTLLEPVHHGVRDDLAVELHNHDVPLEVAIGQMGELVLQVLKAQRPSDLVDLHASIEDRLEMGKVLHASVAAKGQAWDGWWLVYLYGIVGLTGVGHGLDSWSILLWTMQPGILDLPSGGWRVPSGPSLVAAAS